MTIKIYKLCEHAELPEYSTTTAACFDIKACFYTPTVKGSSWPYSFDVSVPDGDYTKASVVIAPGHKMLIPTGLVFCLDDDYHIKLYSRSGNAWKKDLNLFNRPGIIDSDYSEECFVMVYNHSTLAPIRIFSGDRIAQGEVCKNNRVSFVDINKETFDSFVTEKYITSNRRGGFGHTGNAGEI